MKFKVSVCLYANLVIDLMKYGVPFQSLFDMSILTCSDSIRKSIGKEQGDMVTK